MFCNKYIKILIIFSIVLTSGCGIYKPVDTRKTSVNVNDRVKKNIQEGKGYRLFDSERNKGPGVFEFASSNPMWRASVKLLDFTPFSNVDYSGGIIITDWFNDGQSKNNEYIKITIKFLSNEIRADGLDVLVYQKICETNNNCNVSKIDSNLSQEIKLAILKEATLIEELDATKNFDEDFKLPGEGRDNPYKN